MVEFMAQQGYYVHKRLIVNEYLMFSHDLIFVKGHSPSTKPMS